MVLHKRLDYGFNGFQVPAIPRASRSARTRRSCSKKAKDNQMYAFDLLATVAGELLVLKESSPDNELPGRAQFVAAKDTVKQEQLDEEKPYKHDPCDQRSCDESASATRAASSTHLPDFALKGYPHAQEDVSSTPVSIKLESGRSDKLVHVDESIIEKSEGEPIHGKYYSERGLPGFAESHDGELEDEIARQLEVGQRKIGGGIKGVSLDMCISEDPMELDIKPPVYVSSEGSVEVPLCGDHISGGLLPRCEDDVKVDGRDDDEYFSWCNQPSTISNKSFRPPHLGNRRIRKMLASKFRSVAPKFKDGKLSDTDMELKSIFCSRHSCYTRRRTWKCSPFKRRKLFERNSISMSEGRVRREAGPNSPGKGDNGEAAGSASEASSPVAGQESSLKCKDSCVKLRIKSFKIPELFIEIPETATVGSLKRTVVEAVTTIIGGGLRVGVLLQGKKVRDDNKTLLQTGISHDDRLDALGFMLEPINSCGPPSICPEDTPHLLLPCGASQPPTRYPVVPSSNPVVPDASQDPSPIDADNCVQSDHDSGPSTDISSEKTTPNSRALVSMPSMSVEALAVVPLPQKPRRSELVQRRIRRPFSVSEVEALVQAVEKLGTGRWRDVKLRAFDNAKHRTYVDLKDKWKTLVHTARISPHQRRGEPVPQELLDRVLSAHAYWSQQQAKQHGKLPTEPSLLL